jgi:methyl-accepting chemotaxis protein
MEWSSSGSHPMERRTVLGLLRTSGGSLTFRFGFWAGVTLLVFSAVSAYVGARAQEEEMLGQLEREAGRLAELLARDSAQALFIFQYGMLDATVRAFTNDPAIRLIEIKDKSGKVVIAKGDSEARRGLMLATREVTSGGQVIGSVTLGLSAESVQRALRAAGVSLAIREVVGLVLLFAVLAFLIRRVVARPLAQMVELLQGVAEGNLTTRLEVTSEDEVGGLARWFNVSLDKVHEIMREVRQAASHTATASTQLYAAASQLSSGVQEQASSLEETAASLEQITGTVRQNADSARQASELALGSRETAEEGGQVVTAAVNAMHDINNASRKIADIVTLIDEIAFQTNLLALNAAVEAARAGEQGRGFAVVAAEVRNLAQRSSAAASEIKTLIQDSLQKVENGSTLVTRSGQALEAIVTSVKRVTDHTAEIAAASLEQSRGIDQVNKAVVQMEQITQANSSQTEQVASTAHALASQASQLQALVGRFKLRDGSPAPGAAAAAPEPKAIPTAPVIARAPRAVAGEPATVGLPWDEDGR